MLSAENKVRSEQNRARYIAARSRKIQRLTFNGIRVSFSFSLSPGCSCSWESSCRYTYTCEFRKTQLLGNSHIRTKKSMRAPLEFPRFRNIYRTRAMSIGDHALNDKIEAAARVEYAIVGIILPPKCARWPTFLLHFFVCSRRKKFAVVRATCSSHKGFLRRFEYAVESARWGLPLVMTVMVHDFEFRVVCGRPPSMHFIGESTMLDSLCARAAEFVHLRNLRLCEDICFQRCINGYAAVAQVYGDSMILPSFSIRI